MRIFLPADDRTFWLFPGTAAAMAGRKRKMEK